MSEQELKTQISSLEARVAKLEKNAREREREWDKIKRKIRELVR